MCQFTPGISSEAAKARRTLADYVAVPGVYPAGRLDFDSEGLLLLTDDGVLQHRLTDPRYGHPRTYQVQVEGTISEEGLRRLRSGVNIQNRRTQPCLARAIEEPRLPPREPPIRYRKNIPASWLELTLTEGRNRQVRRMTAAIGFPTLRLIRVAMGPLRIGELAPGEWRVLRGDEVKTLQSTVRNPKQCWTVDI